MLSELLGTFFVLLLVAGVPVLSYKTARDPKVLQAPRIALYFSAVISQWTLAAVGLLVLLSTPLTFAAVGLKTASVDASFRWAGWLILLAMAAVALSLLLERRGWWPEEAALVRMLIPVTRREKVWAVLALAPTAALAEEFLYRGFLLAELVQWFHSVPWAWAASSIAFGLAHTYQGAAGVVRAAALGALLAYPVIHLGSLYPSMGAHFVIDAVALGWLGPAFAEKEPRP